MPSIIIVFSTKYPASTQIYTLSLHDALPISEMIVGVCGCMAQVESVQIKRRAPFRSEEHTSELQSRFDLVCRLLLEKKNRTFRRSHRRLGNLCKHTRLVPGSYQHRQQCIALR